MRANQISSATARINEEFTIRTVSRKDGEITIIERKQEPLRIDGFDL
jgi:hypothetical protein